MTLQTIMRQFARWHIWLAWLFGVPIVLWTLSGLFMVLRPIEEVRGEHLLRADPAIEAGELVLPRFLAPVRSAELAAQPDGPVWIVSEASGGRYRYSARDGSAVPPVIASEARRIADAAYAGNGALETITYHPQGTAPDRMDGAGNLWLAQYADGTHLYIADATGEVLGVRTQWWRAYDFMWGLHIMDLQRRENSHHPVLILFASISLAGTLLGLALMFRRRRLRRRRSRTALSRRSA